LSSPVPPISQKHFILAEFLNFWTGDHPGYWFVLLSKVSSCLTRITDWVFLHIQVRQRLKSQWRNRGIVTNIFKKFHWSHLSTGRKQLEILRIQHTSQKFVDSSTQ
jgi:hypothetical protein